MRQRKHFPSIRRPIVLLLVLILTAGLFPALRVSAGAFSDVSEEAWYAADVADMERYGILNGVGSDRFDPGGIMTLAEAVTMAARTFAYTGGETVPHRFSSPWYQDYVQYAAEQGLCSPNEFGSDYTKSCDRLTMATLFARAFPRDTEQALNQVETLPDVQNSADNRDVFFLYEQGVLTGVDGSGTFLPYSSITRAEVAAILNRVLDTSKRRAFTLTKETAAPSATETPSVTATVPAVPDSPVGLYTHVADLNEGAEFGPSQGWLELKEGGSAVLFLQDVAYGPINVDYIAAGTGFTLRFNGSIYSGTIEGNKIVVNIPFYGTDDYYTFARKGSPEETALRTAAETAAAKRRSGMNEAYMTAVWQTNDYFSGPMAEANARGTYYGRMMCSLYDIDGNGVKELLITFNHDEAYSLYAVYTISGGQLTRIALSAMPPTFARFDCWYLGGNRTLCHEWQTDSVYGVDFYRLSGASLRFIESYVETYDDYLYSSSAPAYGRTDYSGFRSVSGWFIESVEDRYPGMDLDTYFYPF